MTRTRRLALLAGLLAMSPAWADDTANTGRTLSLTLDPARAFLAGTLVQALPVGGRFRLLDGLDLTEARCGVALLDVEREHDGHWRLPPCDAEAMTLAWQGQLAAAGRDARHRLSEAGSLLPTRGGWYPHLGDAAGPLHLAITTPPGQRALGLGSLVEEREGEDGSVARFHHPHTREVTVAAGPWRLREREAHGVLLRTLFPAALDAAFAERYLESAAGHLAAFQARLGPLPFASFTIAASPAPVGLAFPGFTLLGETVIPLPFIPETSLPHELMHAWWGAGVRVDAATGDWSEALTTYLADHAVAEARGEAVALRRRWLEDLAALAPHQERPLAAFRGGPDPAGRLIGYQHGALVFHMLRQRLGDEAFDAALRAFAERWMHRPAGWPELAAAFGAVAGEALAAWLDAWLTRPGRPRLTLEDVAVTPAEAGYRLDGVLVQQGDHAPWPLAVPLRVESAAGTITLTQPMTAARQAFSVTLPGPPRQLRVDPEAELLRHPGAVPSRLRELLLAPDTRALALDADLAALASRALGREVELLTGDATPDAPPPLLVIGSTDRLARWRRQQGLAAPPRAIERAGEARVWMQPDRPIGLLGGDDAEALARLAARLRHHGRQSYLVQDATGEIADAGRWPVVDDPLRVDFPP